MRGVGHMLITGIFGVTYWPGGTRSSIPFGTPRLPNAAATWRNTSTLPPPC